MLKTFSFLFIKMDLIKPENLIGKKLKEVNLLLDANFNNYMLNKNLYFNSYGSEKSFYSMFYNTLSIITNDDKEVISVTIHFNGIINDFFYNSFILDYNNPTTIQVIDSRKILSEETLNHKNNIQQHLKQREISLREGTFEEKPLFMLWNNKKFQIKVFIRHEQNISELTFRLPSDQF